tara:strand:- start:761 stop:1123 length:363 start_codon:yes stop_codon:yes gene_type:complete
MSSTGLGMKIFSITDPEDAHRITINLLRFELFPKNKILPKDPVLEQNIFGINFFSPFGLAVGFDNDGEAFELILALGCGFVEVGSFTPRPQFGNPKPRAFRSLEDEATISRYGFNSKGLA